MNKKTREPKKPNFISRNINKKPILEGHSHFSHGKNREKTSGKSGNSSPCNPPQPIPSIFNELISSFICKKTGKEHIDIIILDRIRQSVMAQKASYWKDSPGKSVKYGRAYDIFAYISYHLPVYFTQFRNLFGDLHRDGVLPESVTLFDIGTGPGVVPMAMMDLWKKEGTGLLEIYALERSEEQGEAFTFFTSGFKELHPLISVHPVIQADLTTFSPASHLNAPKKVTIVSFQNVIAELEHLSIPARASIVLSYTELLDDDGFLIIVEPAEMRHATSLRRLQKELIKGGLHVYAPCSYLWGSGCDPSQCWTFREDTSIQPTELMNLLAGDSEGYRFVNTDIKFSYLIMTKGDITRSHYRVPRTTRMVRLSHLERYDRRVITIAGSRMSGEIGNRGMHIFKICDGTCREPVYAVLSGRNRRPSHSALFAASYGDILIFSKVQVRRHEKHTAWNLIISKDSIIEYAEARVKTNKKLSEGQLK